MIVGGGGAWPPTPPHSPTHDAQGKKREGVSKLSTVNVIWYNMGRCMYIAMGRGPSVSRGYATMLPGQSKVLSSVVGA